MTTPPEPSTVDLERIKQGVSRIQGKAAGNQVIKDLADLVFECASLTTDNAHLRDRLALAEAKLAESERVSAERLARLSELRDTLTRIETASRKLGVAPGQLGDMAGRILGGPTRP